MKKLLLVEDSKETFQMVDIALKSIVDLKWASSLEEADKYISSDEFDLFLLDMELPDGSGIELCSQLNAKYPRTPIFFLTAHKELSEKVLSFSAGADDYIVKPFEPLELKARVEARLRKSEQMSEQQSHLKWKELQIDTLKQEVSVLDGDSYEIVELTSLEFKLLMFFATHVGHVVERNQILDELWGKDVHVYPRSVDTHVSKLRKKIKPVADVIASVHGAGYKFNPTTL